MEIFLADNAGIEEAKNRVSQVSIAFTRKPKGVIGTARRARASALTEVIIIWTWSIIKS